MFVVLIPPCLRALVEPAPPPTLPRRRPFGYDPGLPVLPAVYRRSTQRRTIPPIRRDLLPGILAACVLAAGWALAEVVASTGSRRRPTR